LEEPLIDPDADVASYRANFERLLAISDQRTRLLESLLTLSGSEHGSDRCEPVDLAELVERVVRDRPADGLTVRPSLSPAPILGDPTLIERLVANLYENAVHYNIPDGRVEISVVDGPPRLRIANTGTVVLPEHVDRLFEPFQRLHRTADDGHHGLGLSIVRAIAAAHNATLTARPRISGGLVVEVAFTGSVSQASERGRRSGLAPSG
jgi:signal transduction histidine kinase